MGEVVFMVEPDSRAGARWHIKRSGSIRATYTSRAQAVMDARQLAAFENELRGQMAIVRVLDAERRIAEDHVCALPSRTRPIDRPRAAGAKLVMR
jgi:hypothetical protein